MSLQKKRKFRIAKYIVYRETVVNKKDLFWTFVGGFTGIGAIGIFQQYLFSVSDAVFLIGSFGASAVLIYGAAHSPLAQPRNLIGGHLLSAFIGVTAAFLIPQQDLSWLASALAVSLSIVFMQITKTLHPPGGATALIAVIGSDHIKSLGYWYILSPVGIGVIILFVIAMITNSFPENRKYPYPHR